MVKNRFSSVGRKWIPLRIYSNDPGPFINTCENDIFWVYALYGGPYQTHKYGGSNIIYHPRHLVFSTGPIIHEIEQQHEMALTCINKVINGNLDSCYTSKLYQEVDCVNGIPEYLVVGNRQIRSSPSNEIIRISRHEYELEERFTKIEVFNLMGQSIKFERIGNRIFIQYEGAIIVSYETPNHERKSRMFP